MLVGQFVGWHGSARPIARVDVHDSSLRFGIPPQWQRGTSDLTVEGQLQGDHSPIDYRNIVVTPAV